MSVKVDVTRNAVISDCEKYRYTLYRKWDKSKPIIMFLMLNPSTADATFDDPTIRRCIGFAKSWGYGGLFVGNLFAYRATNPKSLFLTDNPIGKNNEEFIGTMARLSQKIVCAWGNSAIVKKLLKKHPNYKPLLGLGNNTYYIDLSNDGTPKHPLYLKGDLELKNY